MRLSSATATVLAIALATGATAAVRASGATDAGAAEVAEPGPASLAATGYTYDGGLSKPREDSYYPGKGDPGVDVLHYDLDLVWKRSRRLLVGDALLDFRATSAALAFQLDLGESLAVREVLVDDVPAGYEHTGKNLVVHSPVSSNSRHTVRIRYRGTPESVHAPTTRSDFNTVGMKVTDDGQLRTMQEPFGAFTWYPSNDHPSDKALYDIEVTAPGDWVGVSNGTLRSRVAGKNQTTTTWHLGDPVATYLMTLAVGPYAHRTDIGPHGLPLHFWLPRGNVDRYLSVFRHVSRDLSWLESKLGRYPFRTAGAVVVPGNSAMETQSLVTFGAKRFFARGAEAAREVMVHELAHQWYGDTVTPNDWADLWLNEGMAMYLQGRWNATFTPTGWREWANHFSYYNRVLRGSDGPPAAYDRGEFAQNCVYLCTAAMYEELREKLGSEAFWALVRDWPQEHLNGSADREMFVAWVEAETGRELSGFFDDWLLSPTWPPA